MSLGGLIGAGLTCAHMTTSLCMPTLRCWRLTLDHRRRRGKDRRTLSDLSSQVDPIRMIACNKASRAIT